MEKRIFNIFGVLTTLYRKYEEIINYVIIGGLTTVVSIVVKYVLLFTVLDAKDAIQLEAAVVASWVAACSFAYVTNRKFVFKSTDTRVVKEATKFFSSRLVTLGVEAALMWLFVSLMGFDTNTQVAIITLVVQVVVIVANYVLSKLFVFKKNTKCNEKDA